MDGGGGGWRKSVLFCEEEDSNKSFSTFLVILYANYHCFFLFANFLLCVLCKLGLHIDKHERTALK